MLSASDGIPVPKNGILDLRECVLDDQSIFNLNGEWLFHWEKLLGPENFEREKAGGFPVKVPSYWTSYEIDGQSLPGWGYGTYSLTIILPKNFQAPICMDIPLFDVAYKFFLNDRVIGENGEVGTNREEEDPGYESSSFCYIPDGDTLQLLIQVSNFHHRRGGFWQSLVMGSSGKVLERKEKLRMFNYSTVGVLLVFMIFFAVFWSFSRKETVMLLFALTSLGMLLRAVNTGFLISNLFFYTSWSWLIRLEYLGSYLGLLFGMLFLHKLFPNRHMNKLIQINTGLMILACISLFVLPVHLFSYEMIVYQPLLVLYLTHFLGISAIGTIKGKAIHAVFFTSLSFFIFTLINDILVANSVRPSSSTYLTQISFQLLILSMAVVIIIRWVRNYKMRLQLEDSLRFKNRVLSVIAHDLKNPIANVAQFSNLLVSKPELATKKQIMNSLRESSEAAVTLLDNLLYWGRSESESLSIVPTPVEMEELIHEVEALYQHMAIQKEIAFSSEVQPGIITFADPILANIILRNLVANAIKFTRQGGSVRIKAWQELNQIHCSVVDTGVGLKPEFLEQFEKEGYLGSSAGTDQEVGTGLGLQLVKDLLEKNKGSLKIKSTVGEGSTFSFILPANYKD